ncbi:ankyrin repeat-containing domain protein [Plectosphaerella cucumerina]|uniref:Ankyrin repeat-containing domain protein n=1 Tax=Plectosphaerella cucumerina TaxID=40658 RepID=A0A8K0X6B4_9PEZI|nr:ankyrin repeat-containing domain protein [Plectosphaerella cucumerina]
MAPTLSADEIDDLIYFARAGELSDLQESLSTLSARESAPAADILAAARDEGKSTCLHMAAGNGHLETVTAILSHFTPSSEPLKAYLDLPNEFGNASLHWACLGGHLEVVKVLLAAGADPTAANGKDQIPLDLALFAEKRDVVDHFMGLAGGLEGQNGEEGGLSSGIEVVEVVEVGEEDEGKGKDKAEAEA